jgi:hypothetical protein
LKSWPSSFVGAGGFAYSLYRKDTRPRRPGDAEPPAANRGLMFGRDRSKPDGKD